MKSHELPVVALRSLEANLVQFSYLMEMIKKDMLFFVLSWHTSLLNSIKAIHHPYFAWKDQELNSRIQAPVSILDSKISVK